MHQCFRYFRRAALLVLVSAAGMLGADPSVGKWVLNVKKSTYRPGAAPKSQIRTYQESASGIVATVVTVSDEGETSTVSFPVNDDGQSRPVTGSTSIDAIRMGRVDRKQLKSQLMQRGKQVATTVREVSEDGNTLTITYDGGATDGSRVHYVAVFDRFDRR